MTIKATLSRAIIGAGLLAAGFISSSAHAGTTTMTVTVPEYIVLRFYPENRIIRPRYQEVTPRYSRNILSLATDSVDQR